MNQMSRSDRPAARRVDLPDIVRVAAWMVVAALTITGLYVGKQVIVPLVIAFLIGFALSPLVSGLTRRGVPRLLAVIGVMLAVGMVVAGLGALLTTQLRSLSDQLPVYQSTIQEKVQSLGRQLRSPGTFDGAVQTVTRVTNQVSETIGEGEHRKAQLVEIAEPPMAPLRTAVEWLSPMLGPLATTGIVVVFVFLVLLDKADLRDRLIRLSGENLYRSTDAMQDAGRRVSKYLLMQLLVNVIYGIPLAVGLYFIGVPGWLLWGALAALMRFIPYMGPLLSAIFPLALAFAVDPGWDMVMWTIALILALELISNNVIEPLLYGASTGLSAISLITAAIFWTALWGPAGLILSTPLTVCLLVIGRAHPQLQFLEVLLGSNPVLDVPTRIYQRLIAGDPEEAFEIAESVIEEEDVIAFYNMHGTEILRRVSDDYHDTARAEHRLRVADGMATLVDTICEEFPDEVPEDVRPGVVCVGGKWRIDSIASEMLSHALRLKGIAAQWRNEGGLSSRYVDKLDLDEVKLVCLSYFSPIPERSIRSYCRRIRQRWPDMKIVLVLLNSQEAFLHPEAFQALGADGAASSLKEAVERCGLELGGRSDSVPAADGSEGREGPRPDALESIYAMAGTARDELDAIARWACEVLDVDLAVISVLDGEEEVILGQSRDLPSLATRPGFEFAFTPRSKGLVTHVLDAGEPVVIEDTERDPRFAEHPVIRRWKARCYCAIPLRTREGEAIGALAVLHSEARRFTDEEMSVLQELAATAFVKATGDEGAGAESERTSDPSSATVGRRVPK